MGEVVALQRPAPEEASPPSLLPPDGAGSDSEEAVGAALRAGDRDRALALLMELHGEALYRFCRGVVDDPDLAEEAHQMTFVQAYEGLTAFEGRSSFKTWLFSIARHRCLDGAKIARRRRRRIEAAAELPERPDPGAGAAAAAERRDLAAALRACLAKLPPKVRSALLLRFQEEISYVEMERVLGERAATLQARVVRALPRLRRCLVSRGITP